MAPQAARLVHELLAVPAARARQAAAAALPTAAAGQTRWLRSLPTVAAAAAALMPMMTTW